MNEQKLKEEIAFLRQLLGFSFTLTIASGAGIVSIIFKENLTTLENYAIIAGLALLFSLFLLTFKLIYRIFNKIKELK